MRRLLPALLLLGSLAPCYAAFGQDLSARRERWRREVAQPSAALAVLGALERWAWEPPEEVADFLDQAATAKGAHPLAQAHALYLGEMAQVRLGRSAVAAAYRQALGLAETWMILGPFPSDSGAGMARAFLPEETADDLDLVPRIGKKGRVSWREVPALLVLHGRVPMGGLLYPDDHAVAYALTYVHSDQVRDVAVRAGSTGALRVWVNGRLALAGDVGRRPVALDQSAGAARLGIGWNRVLVKLGVREGAWAFLLRMTASNGARIPSLRWGVDAARPFGRPAGPKAGSVPRGPAAPIATLVAHLEARAQKARREAREDGLRDLAAYHAEVHPGDPAAKQVDSTLAPYHASTRPDTLLFLARHGQDRDLRRRSAERALDLETLAPGERAEAAWRLGTYYAEETRLLFRADELYQQAVYSDPRFVPARVSRAERMADLDLNHSAAEELWTLHAEEPAASAVTRALAHVERRRDRLESAQALLSSVWRQHRDDVALLGDLTELCLRRGDGAGAATWSLALAEARPYRASGYAELARVRLAYGDVDGALAAYEAGLRVAPDDPLLNEASGRLAWERADAALRTKAVARLRHALALRPQNPELRNFLLEVEPREDGDLERRYARAPKELIESYRDFGGAGERATVLLDLRVTRVHDNGLAERFVERLIRIDSAAGADAEGTQSISYSPDTQTLEVRAARVHKPDGQIVEATTRGTGDLSEPWYGLYYDVRAETVGFGSLESGDVIELSYLLADVGQKNILFDYFGDLHFFAELMPRAESVYVLLVPPSREFFIQAPTLPGLTRTIDAEGQETRYRFRATRVPKLELESGMPGWMEVAPYLHASTYRSWEEVARTYWGLLEDQLGADDAIRTAARNAVRGLAGEEAKVRAIYNLVVKSTRYVGLEFGIHGYQPYRATDVYARKFGDCKDKASLIVVMLREVGIAAHLALVRTRKNGDLAAHPASLAVFDHAIAYVPALGWYLDGTAEFAGATELPAEDQGVTVLVIDGQEGKLVRTPFSSADDNRVRRTFSISLGQAGDARIREDLLVSGQAAAEWRSHYQAKGEQKEKYEKAWNALFPGAKITALSMPALSVLDKPVAVVAEGTVPDLGARVAGPSGEGGGRALPAFARASVLVAEYARTSQRQHDLLLAFPWTLEETIVYDLPRPATGIPPPTEIRSPFGSLVTTVEGSDRNVRLHYVLRVDRRRIAVAEYAAWREFLGRVDAVLNQRLVVGP